MKAGELAVALGVARDTLYTWMKRPEVARYLSAGALGDSGTPHRVFSEDDVLVFKTVTHLRYTENVTDWQDIDVYLDSGKREQEFPQNAISADKRTVPIQQAEQSARAMATLTERDNALARVRELEGEIEKIHTQYKASIEEMKSEQKALNETWQNKYDAAMERLYGQIAELRYTIGRLEAEKGRGE